MKSFLVNNILNFCWGTIKIVFKYEHIYTLMEISKLKQCMMILLFSQTHTVTYRLKLKTYKSSIINNPIRKKAKT